MPNHVCSALAAMSFKGNGTASGEAGRCTEVAAKHSRCGVGVAVLRRTAAGGAGRSTGATVSVGAESMVRLPCGVWAATHESSILPEADVAPSFSVSLESSHVSPRFLRTPDSGESSRLRTGAHSGVSNKGLEKLIALGEWNRGLENFIACHRWGCRQCFAVGLGGSGPSSGIVPEQPCSCKPNPDSRVSGWILPHTAKDSKAHATFPAKPMRLQAAVNSARESTPSELVSMARQAWRMSPKRVRRACCSLRTSA